MLIYTGYIPVVLESLDTYTPMIQQLICQPEFNILHLGVLLLEKCGIPIPGGFAVDKCCTFCIKSISAYMKQGMSWDLVQALIKHGTVPDVAAIEISMQYNKPKATLFIAENIKETVPYDHFLSLAISMEWHGQFVNYCISQGGRFSPNDIWSVLRWENDSKAESMLEKILKNGGSADVKDIKGCLPLNFLLDNNMFTKVLILLKHGADTSTVDISGLIKKLIKLALLIECGADITCIADHDKSTTPVHVATIIALYVKGKKLLCSYYRGVGIFKHGMHSLLFK